MPEQPEDQFQKILIAACDKAASDLIGIADSVQIFVTYQNGNQKLTESYNTGSGNFYSRLGQIKEWIIRQDEYIRVDAAREQNKDYDDEE